MPSCTLTVAALAKSLKTLGVNPETGWWASCPTCRKPSWPCWLPPAWGRSGPPVRRTLGSRASWTVSARSSPRSFLPPTAIPITAKALIPWDASPTSLSNSFDSTGGGGPLYPKTGHQHHPQGRLLPGLSFPGVRPGNRLCPGPGRSPPLHHVFLRHHRPAQMHGPGGGRDLGPSPQRIDAPYRSETGRHHLLFHHLRLDDVELADQFSGLRGDAGAVRRLSFLSRSGVLWKLAQDEKITVFGTSARYIAVLEKRASNREDL